MNSPKRRRFFIQTFGCQMNVNDSERLAGLLRARGLEPASDKDSADFVFLNTCAVREKATTKLHHALARLRRRRREDPEFRIGVGGCVAQLEGEAIRDRAPHVDLLVGTHNLHRVPELLEGLGPGEHATDLDRKADPFAIAPSLVAHANPVRAYVTAIEGCNQVCSFCVVPRTRGPETNRPAGDIVAECRDLAARGFREVMLLGQTVNAYRRDGVDFAGLLESVHEVEGLARVRFTTSHPSHVSMRMIEAFARLPKVCPYLHLPFQSGSDRILESMRRGYTRQGYLDVVERLRDRVPHLRLSTDVIVGYPGETVSEFEETMDVVRASDFSGVFAFTYSPRPGTTAARLADDVAAEEKSRRLQILNAWQQARQRQQNLATVGTVDEVLIETAEEGRVSGRTRDFRIVHLEGSPEWIGRLVRAEMVHAGPNALRARPVQDLH